jgi:hypothetical protein
VEQLGAAAHHAVPLLAEARQVPRHVHDHDQRHAECVAHPDEPGRLLRRRGVQAAAHPQRVVRHHADGAPGEAAQRRDDVRRPLVVQVHAGLVEQRPDQRLHVVGPVRLVGQQGAEVDVGRHVVGGDPPLPAQHGGQHAGLVKRRGVVLGGDVHDAGPAPVRVGPGHEDPAGVAHDHDVGESRPVRGAAGRRPEHDGELRHASGRPHHRREHLAHRVQRDGTLREPGAAGVPQPQHRHPLPDRGVDRIDDVPAALAAHRPTHPGGVGGERDRRRAADLAAGRQHTRRVAPVEQPQRSGIEEGAQPHLRVAEVDRRPALDIDGGGLHGGS